jgi:hypothetical protein
MPFHLNLLPALRDWGLNVIEVNGWRTRGNASFNPGGAVNHHTAGARSGKIPSLNILVNGREGLTGPLCNVGQSRSTQFDAKARFDDVYLIAAGRANHAGAGGWRGLVGNSAVFGLEIEHVGSLAREPFDDRRQETAYRVHRAFMEVGGFSTGMVCQHKEWAPNRKIDFIDANGERFRQALLSTAKRPTVGQAPNAPKEEDTMFRPGMNLENVVRECYQRIVGREPESKQTLDSWHWALATEGGVAYHNLVTWLHHERRLIEEAKFQQMAAQIAAGKPVHLTLDEASLAAIRANVYADLTGRIK